MAYYDAAILKVRAPSLVTAEIPDEDIEEYVAEFEETAEDWITVAFEEREETWTATDRTRYRQLILPNQYVRSVTAASLDGVVFTEDDLTDLTDTLDGAAGILTRTAGWWGRLVITYTHGLDEPTPALLRACRLFVRVKALDEGSSKPQEIIDYQDDSGFRYRVGTPDPLNDRPTGIMEADSVLNRLRTKYRAPTIA